MISYYPSINNVHIIFFFISSVFRSYPGVVDDRTACESHSRLMKDSKRQARVIELDRKVREALSNRSKSKMGAPQDPDGFLEGALLNKDVSAAHDRFVADVEVGAVATKE